jgi:peptide/nickel transport system substrate-binding protein
MNSRSGLLTFFLFLFLAVIILFHVLSMIQADRLYDRLNQLIDKWQTSAPAPAASLLLTNTAGVGSSQPSTSTASPAEQYPGDEGDWLVWCLAGEPRTLNPYSVESTIDARTITTPYIFERLFEYDLDVDYVKLKPWLAETWQQSSDGLEVTIKLRNDIHFSDGVPITADDVLFTYQTIMDPNVDAADIRNYYHNFKDVIKIDDRTVKFVFNELYWKTIESVGIFEVLPKHIYQYKDAAQFNNRRSNPLGSGPYVFEKWNVGQEIVLRRNERYWGVPPKLDKVVFRFITNTTAALQALRSHDVDYLEPSSEQFVEMSADPKFKDEFHIISYWEPSHGFAFIGWNQATPFFADKRVRLAMTYMIDRQAIAEHLLKGQGKIVTGPFYIFGRQNDPNIQPWPYDIEQAKQLLDQAGWRDSDGDGIRDKDGTPFRFKFSYPTTGAVVEQIARLLKDEGAMVGVEVIADPLEWSIFVERVNNRQFESCTMSWGGTIESDPYQIYHSSQIAGRGNNFVGFKNTEADAVIEEARRTLDEDKRYALYHRFCQILHEEQPYTFLITRPTFNFLDKRFENVKIHKLGVYPPEWYVPKDKQKYK